MTRTPEETAAMVKSLRSHALAAQTESRHYVGHVLFNGIVAKQRMYEVAADALERDRNNKSPQRRSARGN